MRRNFPLLLWFYYFNFSVFWVRFHWQFPSMCGFSRERHKKATRPRVAFLFKGTPPSPSSPHTHRHRKRFGHVYSRAHPKLQLCIPDWKDLWSVFKGTTINAFCQSCFNSGSCSSSHMQKTRQPCSALAVLLNRKCCDLTALVLLIIKSASGV